MDPSARRALVLRTAALAPLAGAALVYALAPGARAALDEGVALLVRGDLEGLEAWGQRLGPWAVLGTTVLMVVQAIAAPIPAVFVTWTNAWLFGPLAGAFLSIAQATLAAAFCFGLARAFGEPLVARLLSARALDRANGFMARHGTRAVLVARLLPIVPFDPVSYAAGLTRVSWRSFLAATFVGQIPAGVAYSYLGREIRDPARFAVLGVGVFLALLAIGTAFRRVAGSSDEITDR